MKHAHGIAAFVSLLAATGLVLLGKLTGEQWVDLAKWILGFFSGTHAVVAFTERTQAPQAVAVPPS